MFNKQQERFLNIVWIVCIILFIILWRLVIVIANKG
ncbi:putative membrane protein (plasmid) [Clostridium botulinum]|nr:putative membrane protein [Clostridium botulinum]APQ71248.1 putative membrane protein [Clostridium botulinum]APR02485.1 putative membrane protein [Clostridium botulinum]